MTVDRTQVGHETRYQLRDDSGLSCMLTYGGTEIEPAVWKILLPGPGGSNDLYQTERFRAPDGPQLRAWLAPIVGGQRADELADAVDAEPPRKSGWRRHGGDFPDR
jgi:hypothetical protein